MHSGAFRLLALHLGCLHVSQDLFVYNAIHTVHLGVLFVCVYLRACKHIHTRSPDMTSLVSTLDPQT